MTDFYAKVDIKKDLLNFAKNIEKIDLKDVNLNEDDWEVIKTQSFEVSHNHHIVDDFLSFKLNMKIQDFIDSFCEIQKEISDDVFWFMWGNIYSKLDFGKRFAEQLIGLTTNRMKISLERRCLMVSYLSCISFKIYRNLVNQLNEYNEDDTLKLFRGFKVRKDKRIKEGDEQIEGKGISYSLVKHSAKFFAIANNDFWTLIKQWEDIINEVQSRTSLLTVKYLKMMGTYEERADEIIKAGNKAILQEMNVSSAGVDDFSYTRFMNDKKYRDEMFDTTKKENRWFTNIRRDLRKCNYESKIKMYEEAYNSEIQTVDLKSYVGTYKVHKKNIILGINLTTSREDTGRFEEKEVICKPEDIKMLRYEVVQVD